MAIDHSTSLPMFRDVVDDLRDYVYAISYVAEIVETTLTDTLREDVARGRVLPVRLLARGISSHVDVLERFDALIAPYRRDQEALEMVLEAAAEAGVSPSELLRHTFAERKAAGDPPVGNP
ncbi:hypothetical protein [Endothiovibrio diazotrophicus]